MMEHIDEFIPPALRGYIPRILGGEMSDWESRVRPSAPVQYIIRDGPAGDKSQSSSVDQSDHSSEGSYTDMPQQTVYTMADNMSYSVPAYESEMGDDVDIIETSDDYAAYSLPGPSTSYAAVDQGPRTVAVRHINPIPRTTVANMLEYSEAGPSTSRTQQILPRQVNTKRPVYAIPTNQIFRKAQVDADGNIVYTHNIQPKRTKTDNYNV
ncbi:hypothetical protein OSTOST_19046 [Ostertagia ostertagi]